MDTRTTHTRIAIVSKTAALTSALALAAWMAIRARMPGVSPTEGARRVSSWTALAGDNPKDGGGSMVLAPEAAEGADSLRALFRSLRREQKTMFTRQMAEFLSDRGDPWEPVGYEHALNLWIGRLTQPQSLTALAHLGASNADEARATDLRARLIRHLAEIDMPSAIQQINAPKTGAARELALENVAIVLANADLNAASGWVDQMPAGEDRDVALFAVANEAVRSQPTEALRLAVNSPPGDATDELIRRAVVEWAVTDQAAATSWAQQLPDEPLRTQVLGALATVWADRDPASAAEFALDALPPGRVQNDALVGVAQRWAQRSPQDAALWVAELPAGQLQSAAADSVAAIWAQSAAAAAHRWRNTVGVGL